MENDNIMINEIDSESERLGYISEEESESQKNNSEFKDSFDIKSYENIKIKKDTPKKINEIGIVVNGQLNLRKKPNINSDVIKILNNGSKVIIISEKNDKFYKVDNDGDEGYCMKNFIKKVK